MNAIRHWINLFETIEIPASIFNQAGERLMQQIDWSGGGGEVTLAMLGYDPYDEDEKPDIKSSEFQQDLRSWAVDRAYQAFGEIRQLFHGNSIRVYRVITAPRNWKPDPNRHPGEYWSWDKDAAEAHWGDFGDDHIQWMLTADVTKDNIDWVTTLAVNGLPDQETEAEIHIPETVPITIIDYRPHKG